MSQKEEEPKAEEKPNQEKEHNPEEGPSKSTGATPRTRPKFTKSKNGQMLRMMQEKRDFLFDFDPTCRERKKQTLRTMSTTGTTPKNLNTVLDENGCYRDSGIDACDCLRTNCIGCFTTPCPGCGGRKCGAECRVNRKYVYVSCNIDGQEEIFPNPNWNPPKRGHK